MGLFDRIFRKPIGHIDAGQTFSTLTAYQPVYRNWNGMLYESELCRLAIDAVARHASKLKVEFVGSAQPALKTAVKHKPNEWMTWSQFLYRSTSILYATNTLFIVPILNRSMDTVGFYPILPENAEIREYGKKIWIRYRFRNGQVGAIEFDKCAVLTRFQYESDFFGSSNRALHDTLKIAHLTKESLAENVRLGSSIRFIAQTDNFIKPEDLKKERKRFNLKNFANEADSGILLFPNTYKNVKQIENKPYTVDTDQMNYIRKNVQDYFGVNDKVINNTASSEELDAFFNGAIEPLAIQLSEAFSKAVFTDLERSYGSAVLVNANRLQYMSTTQKVQLAKELGDRGMLTINEMRELFNYDPLPDGDRAVIRGEYYPLDEKLGGPDEKTGGQDGQEDNS